tara:strand:- start:441 stop:677 length:237 start_codon:yes stop_codon:yes gene_type:complete
MDLLRDLVILKQEYELKIKSHDIYESESDDDEDEREFVRALRRDFINNYLKNNNHQFMLTRDTLKKDYSDKEVHVSRR